MKLSTMQGKGVYLQQYKEPALSREIRTFLNTSANDDKIDHEVGKDPATMEPEDIIQVARLANIIDERDGNPLYKKLLRAAYKNIKTVVVDALDDEPYVSSQIAPLLFYSEEVMLGLKAVMRATGAEVNHIVVYKNLKDTAIRIPNTIDGVKVDRIGGKYPVESHIGAELGLRRSFVTVGICSLIHFARALRSGQVQRTSFVTVAGNCVGNPSNLEVSLGMSLEQVLERCGLVDNPTRVVVGGSMTGIPVIDTENTVISQTTRAVLAFREHERDYHFTCIGCGKCLSVCPSGLDPHTIYKCLTRRKPSGLVGQNAEKCIDCGTCSYICPAKLPLSTTIGQYAYTQQKEVDEYEVDPA